jgi:hypothetical protein
MNRAAVHSREGRRVAPWRREAAGAMEERAAADRNTEDVEDKETDEIRPRHRAINRGCRIELSLIASQRWGSESSVSIVVHAS